MLNWSWRNSLGGGYNSGSVIIPNHKPNVDKGQSGAAARRGYYLYLLSAVTLTSADQL